MNWDALGAIAELLGAVAVFATLAYLTVQVRQNSKAQEQQNDLTSAVIMQSRTDTVINFVNLMTMSESNLEMTANLLTKADLSEIIEHGPKEATKARYLATASRALFENIYEQHKEGFLSDDFYHGAATRNILLWRNAWLNLDTPMSSEFREELERLEA